MGWFGGARGCVMRGRVFCLFDMPHMPHGGGGATFCHTHTFHTNARLSLVAAAIKRHCKAKPTLSKHVFHNPHRNYDHTHTTIAICQHTSRPAIPAPRTCRATHLHCTAPPRRVATARLSADSDASHTRTPTRQAAIACRPDRCEQTRTCVPPPTAAPLQGWGLCCPDGMKGPLVWLHEVGGW